MVNQYKEKNLKVSKESYNQRIYNEKEELYDYNKKNFYENKTYNRKMFNVIEEDIMNNNIKSKEDIDDFSKENINRY